MSSVKVSITRVDEGFTSTRLLGESRAIWRKSVTIGSAETCDVCLPGLPPVAAVVLGVSNHKLLYRVGSKGFEEACQPVLKSLPDYDARVDYSPFEVGPYTIQLGDTYFDGDT